MSEIVKTRKKLIEVALPLEAINIASAREKSIRHGHPSTLHLWWARRPLAAARAVIFSQMVDDPSSHPEIFPTEGDQEKERERLFRIVEALVQWENTTNEKVLAQARKEILKSWQLTCAENRNHPRAKELFNPAEFPAFHDPFAGGGALPLEGQRLGLEVYASDLNPVAVLINKALIEIPPKFAGKPPVNPEVRNNKGLIEREWAGAQGLAADVKFYGQLVRDDVARKLAHLYPTVEVTAEMAKGRSDLQPLLGRRFTVIAWLWASTVKSPNPAFAHVDVPLASSFWLYSKERKQTYVEPIVAGDSYRFVVRVGKPVDEEAVKNGTKVGRGGHFRCVLSGAPIPVDYIRQQGLEGKLGQRLMAVVISTDSGRAYLSPTNEDELIASAAKPGWAPEQTINHNPRDIRTQLYGLTKYRDLFTPRQLVMLTTFAESVLEVRDRVNADAISAGLCDDGVGIAQGGTGALAYSDAVATYLSEVVSKITSYHCKLGVWRATDGKTGRAFGRQAIPMVWDFPEANPFAGAGGDWEGACRDSSEVLSHLGAMAPGHVSQAAAQNGSVELPGGIVVSTDPPYYDNVAYADLSDFFYVWLRHSLRRVFPELLATVVVPKDEELVASPYRHGTKEGAEKFFMSGITDAMRRLAVAAHPSFPLTIYYAFKQSENEGDQGVSSTGWETFLDGVIQAGLAVDGTWPVRTEQSAALKANVNVLASSIVLVCRKKSVDSRPATLREFVSALKADLPAALAHLQRGNIAPVDLAQAAIGPGMAVYTRFAKVLDASGKALSVKQALMLINEILDEVLTEQEGDFDSESRWSVAWFDQFGFVEGDYGVAEVLSKAKNTSIASMMEAGVLRSKNGKVRLLRPDELSKDWEPASDRRRSAWEIVHHLIRALEAGGETEASSLAAKLGGEAEVARELAYRLYTACERKKRAKEAMSYNALVQSWPEIIRLSREGKTTRREQSGLFEESEE